MKWKSTEWGGKIGEYSQSVTLVCSYVYVIPWEISHSHGFNIPISVASVALNFYPELHDLISNWLLSIPTGILCLHTQNHTVVSSPAACFCPCFPRPYNGTPTRSDKTSGSLLAFFLSLHTLIKFCELTFKTYLSLNNSQQLWPKPKYSPSQGLQVL